MDELSERAAVEAEQLTQAQAAENALTVVEEEAGALEMNQAMRTMLEIGKAAGRVQSAQIFGHVADSIHVSQLRQLKATHKGAGLSWEQTCKMVGISRRTAERYLSLADELGDEFFGHCAQIGLSVRTMDAARQLPEDVRRALASGEVVDLEAVTKEALTDAIRTLASEHASEKKALQDELKKAVKAQDKAIDKGADLAGKVEDLTSELEALKEGLPADDKKALARLQEAERPIIAHLALVKNTLDIEGRDPGFVARLVSGLRLIEVMARLTVSVVMARAEGLEPNPEALEDEAQGLNEDIAHHDGRAPHPGV